MKSHRSSRSSRKNIFSNIVSRLLLLGHTDSSSTTTSGLGVLATHSQAPVVTETTVGTDLLQALQVLTQLRVQGGRGQLQVLAVDDVLLPVEEPIGDLVLAGVADDGQHLLDLLLGALSGTLGQVHVGLLQHNGGVATTHSLDRRHGDGHLQHTINVGVGDTQDVLELLGDNETLQRNGQGAGVNITSK